jgi:hypothetical protein
MWQSSRQIRQPSNWFTDPQKDVARRRSSVSRLIYARQFELKADKILYRLVDCCVMRVWDPWIVGSEYYTFVTSVREKFRKAYVRVSPIGNCHRSLVKTADLRLKTAGTCISSGIWYTWELQQDQSDRNVKLYVLIQASRTKAVMEFF